MAIYTDRITLVFPINDPLKQRSAAASLQTLEITESGNEFEKLVPLDPSKVAEYASQFSLPLLDEIEELKTKHVEAITKLSTENAEAMREAIDKLTREHAEALQAVKNDQATTSSQLEATTQAKTALDLKVATLTTEKQTFTSQVSMLEAMVEAQRQEILELAQYRPYNPRWLDGEAFYNRVSKEDMVTLLTSDNPQLVTVGKTIELYRKNHIEWPVILDSDDFKNLVGYVLQSGVFDESEVVEIMRDATREEAYRVPE
jgi:chemotaxis regulatin CheY-phosphate phosphatase CheZ